MTSSADSPTAVPAWRWAAVGGLLLGEYVLLTVVFSADALRSLGGGWSPVTWIDPLGAIGLTTLAAALMIASGGSTATGAEASRALRAQAQPRPVARLLLHAAIFLVFFAISGRIFGAAQVSAVGLPPWLMLWATVAVGVLLSAVSTAVPLAALGPLVRSVRRPLLLGIAVGLLAWGVGRAFSELWWTLGRLTFESASLLLHIAGQRVVVRPEQLELGIDDFVVVIAPSCAGYEGIGVILVFLAAFLLLERRSLRFPRAWILLPIGMAAVWIANVVRIAALILIGRWVSPDIAVGSFHSKAGWVLYSAIALGLATLARRSRTFSGASAVATDETWNPTAVYLLPFLVLMATTLVSGLVSVAFDDLYPLRAIAVGAVLVAYRHSLPLRLVRPSPQSIVWGLFVFLVWVALEPEPDAAKVALWQTHLDLMPALGRTAWISLRVLGSVIAVPIAEELAFRGYLLRRLIAEDFTEVSATTFTWTSLVLSSIAFGALHQRWLAGTIAGACFAVAQIRSGRLEDAVAAHAVANAAIAAAVLLLGWSWLWL